MLLRFGSSPDWQVAERTAKVFLTAPDNPDLIARAAVLAERSLRLRPDDVWMLYTSALAAYRTGQYEPALDRNRRGRAASRTAWPSGAWPGYLATSDALEAMASARLGRPERARAALKQAESILTAHLPAGRRKI